MFWGVIFWSLIISFPYTVSYFYPDIIKIPLIAVYAIPYITVMVLILYMICYYLYDVDFPIIEFILYFVSIISVSLAYLPSLVIIYHISFIKSLVSIIVLNTIIFMTTNIVLLGAGKRSL